jgi:hypothetical protein
MLIDAFMQSLALAVMRISLSFSSCSHNTLLVSTLWSRSLQVFVGP